VLRRKKRPTRGSAADVGVRPTICADVRKWENYVALGKIARPTNQPLSRRWRNPEPGAGLTSTPYPAGIPRARPWPVSTLGINLRKPVSDNKIDG
jgi:hypothetical protein